MPAANLRLCALVFFAALFIAGPAAAAPDLVWTADKGWQKTAAPSGALESAEFDRAFSEYLKGRYSKAGGLFDDVAKTGKEPLAEEARILAAECQLGRKRYNKAFDRFEEFFNAYPASRFIDRVFAGEVEIARAVLGGAKVEALGLRIWSGYDLGEKVVDKIISRRPLSDFAREAQIALARSYFRRRMYIESASAYQQYVELFPEGAEIEEATLGVGKSLYLDAPGPGYDPLPYYKADSAFKSFARLYESSPRVPEALDSSAKVERRLADHYLVVAKWYLRMGRSGPAEIYFKKVVTDYGATGAAAAAKSYLTALAPNSGGGDAQ